MKDFSLAEVNPFKLLSINLMLFHVLLFLLYVLLVNNGGFQVGSAQLFSSHLLFYS